MLQCFAALPTKLYPETSRVGHAGLSRIAILFSGLGFSRHLQQRWRTKRTSWLLMNSQSARKEKKGRRRSEFGRIRFRFNSVKNSANYSRFILIIRHATYRFLLFLLTVSFPRLTPSFASLNSSSTINTTSAFGFRVVAPCFQNECPVACFV